MLGRLLLGVVGTAAALAAACGGTVIRDGDGNQGTPHDQLQNNGASKCEAACRTVTACGATHSCDCSCACPAGTTDCQCGPCECAQQTPEKCASDCNESVQEILNQGPDCEAAMAGLLSCLGGASCTPGGDLPCAPEQEKMKDCVRSTHGGSPPAMAPDPGSSSGTVGLYCNAASGSLAGGAPGGAASNTVCATQWEQCSDGRSYGIACTQAGAGLSCQCAVDGVSSGVVFNPPDCVTEWSQASGWCGWVSP